MEGLEAGADDYLIKPFSARELMARVEANLKMARLRQETIQREHILRSEAQTARDQTRYILESITEAFVAFDQQWCYTYANRSAALLLQLSPEELIGKNVWEEVFPSEVGGLAYRELHRAVAEQVPVSWEEYSQPLGRWLEINAYPSTNGIGVYFRDITERKQAEKALQESEDRLRLALDASKLGMWFWDIKRDTLTWTDQCKALFGLPSTTEMSYDVFLAAVHPDDRQRTHAAVTHTISEQADYDIEYRTLWADGTMRWIAAKGRCTYDPTGQPTYMMGVAIDISERKAAEAAITSLNQDLQNRVNELQTLFEVIPIGILITQDLEFRRIEANPAFAEILDILPGGNASSTPLAHDTPVPYKILRNGKELTADEIPLRRAAIHNIKVENEEVEILRQKDGALFNLYGYAAPLLNEQGNVRGAVGAFVNITDRKRAEREREELLSQAQAARAEAETANRIKDEFLAVLSHELRSPLNPILGWIRLLRSGKLDQKKTAHALEVIERNAQLQTQLIEDLLDVSRILRGKLRLEIAPVNLVSTIEAAIETVCLAAQAKSIQIQTVFDPTVGLVLGDAARLQQVVWNLLSNAVKFTESGGRIEVRLKHIDSQAQIQVSDTGKGIHPDFLPYVFEYFRQADATTTRKFGGLGLGLAIVRHLVELHGGTVVAESPGEGQGATFTVRLSLLKNQDTSIQDEDKSYVSQSESLSLTGMRVFVVDDDADTRELIGFILEQRGAIVTSVASALEALQVIEYIKPDVLISDIGMPDMDGYMLMREIRTMPNQNSQILAIALTAYAGETNHKQALAAGFQHHLTKPVDAEQLVQTIVTQCLR